MSTLICAATLWSCGIACIEAILADNGIKMTQNEIIHNNTNRYPAWATQPGFIGPADFEGLLSASGLLVKTVRPHTFLETITELADINTVGAIMWVSKFWDHPVAKNKLIDQNHALRLVSASKAGVMVMNPYRCPFPGRDEFYTWPEVKSFDGGVLVFKK